MTSTNGPRLKWIHNVAVPPELEVVHDSGPNMAVFIGKRLVPSFYWEKVDKEFSLIEVGVDQQSGRLTKLSVPLYKGAVDPSEWRERAEDSVGVPCFDVGMWQPIAGSNAGDFIQVKGRISVGLVKPDLWHIRLYDDPVVSGVYVDDALWFGLNSRNEVSSIVVNTTGASPE